MTRPALYHFTCDHGRQGIEQTGDVRPMGVWLSRIAGIPTGLGHAPPVVWLTSDPMPSRDAVGLTSTMLDCDRMQYRFDLGPARAWPWRTFAEMHGCTNEYWQMLVGTSWGRPDTWYVATRPIPVVGWVRTEAVAS